MNKLLRLIPVLCFFGPVILSYINSDGYILLSKKILTINLTIFIVNIFFVFTILFIKTREKKVIQEGEVVSLRYLTEKELLEENGNCELTVRFIFSGSTYLIKYRVMNVTFYKKGSIVNVEVNVQYPQKSIVSERIRGTTLGFLIPFLFVSGVLVWQMVRVIKR